MRESWLSVVARVMRPSRPRLEACNAAREKHIAARRRADETKARAMADVVCRIESARADVFAAQNGVVSRLMTDLEREWRTLSRRDRDQNIMDLWATIAPPEWLDRKIWRDAPPASQLDTAVALASDPEGITLAERAIGELRTSIPFGPRIRWAPLTSDVDVTSELLAAPTSTLSSRFIDGAHAFAHEVHEAVLEQVPDWPLVARSVAHAAFVDEVCREARLASPVGPLREIFATGYVVTALDDAGVTLGL